MQHDPDLRSAAERARLDTRATFARLVLVVREIVGYPRLERANGEAWFIQPYRHNPNADNGTWWDWNVPIYTLENQRDFENIYEYGAAIPLLEAIDQLELILADLQARGLLPSPAPSPAPPRRRGPPKGRIAGLDEAQSQERYREVAQLAAGGLSQQALAERYEVDRTTIQRWLRKADEATGN